MAQIVETEQQRRARQEREAAATALYRARGLDPNRAALAGQAASVLGLPPMVVRDSQDLIAQARERENIATLQQHQRSLRWMGQPGNAEVASDQVDSLTEIERLSTSRFRTPDAMIGQRARTPDSLLTQEDDQRFVGILRRIPGDFGASLGSSGEGLNTFGLRALDRLGLGDSGIADYFRAERDVFSRIGSGGRNIGGNLRPEEVAQARRQGIETLPQTRVDTGLAGDVAGGIGQVGASALIAISTAGYGTLPALFGQGVDQMDERVQADQRRDGRTEYSLADDAALLGGGVVTGLSEKLGLDAILGRLPAPVRQRLTNKLVDVFVAGAVEGSSEVVEGVGQNALAMSLLGEDGGLLDGTVEGGTVGAAVGSIARALVLTAIPGRQHARDQIRADVADAAASDFDRVVEAVNANPLLARSPERMQDFLNQVNEGETVFIPAEAVATFFQSNPDLQDWMDEWDIRDQYEAALVSGADIAMPVGDYLAKVGPTEAHAAWRDDLRHGLEAMSVKEAAAFREGGTEALNTQLDAAVDEALTPDASQAVFDDWVRQARSAGFTMDVANTQAALVARAFSQRAARSGGRFADALAAYRDANLSIRQELPETIRQNMDQTDVMIEALRQARRPAGQRAMFGRSLGEFVSQEGGVLDTGGELAAMGADQWHRNRRVGTRRLIRPRAETGNSAYETDAVAQRAVEAGYLPDGSTGNDLLEAIRNEIAGRPTYSQAFERDSVMEANRQAIDDLEVLLGQLGIDVNTATNAEIKAAIDRVANAPEPVGDTLYQGGRLNTDSEAFRAWFGDSKVVDENGDPLVVYHGTPADFDAFDTDLVGGRWDVSFGFHFSDRPEEASLYAGSELGSSDGSVLPVYLSIQNPLVIETGIEAWRKADDDRGEIIRAIVQSRRDAQRDDPRAREKADADLFEALGLEAPPRNYSPKQAYDGVIIKGSDGINVIAFRPEQIKSVFNRGTFDPNDPRILYQVSPDVARSLDYETRIPTDPLFAEAVENTPGATLTESGLLVDLVRFQKPEQGGETSVRTGVFYLPTGSTYARHYKSGPNSESYGGPVRVEGQTLVRAPLFVKGQTGGKAPEVAYDSLKGKGAAAKLGNDIFSAINQRGWMRQRGDDAVFEELVQNLLVEHDADPNLAYEIIRNSQKGNQLRYALQENIIAHAVRSAGYDAVVGYSKGKSGAFLTEVFDVREDAYPTPDGGFSLHSDFGGRTYFQNDGTKRGQVALSPEARTITLFKSRDLSTFFHEFGHVTLDLLSRDADLSPEAQADLDIALKYLGVDSVDAIGVDQHELWARSFENYLMEGKAPSADLRSVFRTIKSWMVSIYRTALNLRAPLSDEIRGVFDRLLASDEEIEAATRDLALDAELSEIERETMTPQQQAEYGRLMNAARSQAETVMLDRMMRAIRKERTAEWNAWADEIRPRVAEEIDAQPDIRAIQWMRGSNVGLDRAEVIRILGDEAGLSLLPKGIPPIIRKSGGVHPDSVAEASGYGSGRELLNGLMEHEAERRRMREAGDNRTVRAARIEAQVKADLLELYGDPLENGSIEAEAMAALHGERMDRAIAARWGVVARSANMPPPPPIAAMRQWAAEKIGSRTVRDAKSGKYLRAERKAATAAEKALKAGNKAEAARHMQARTVNRLLYSEARKAEEFAGVAIRRLSRLDGARTMRSMDQEYLEQIQALLEQYDLRPVSGRQVQRRKSLMEFVADQEALGNEVQVPPELIAAASKTSVSELTVDELRALDDTIKSLAHLGRLKQTLLDNQERRDYEAVIDEMLGQTMDLRDRKGLEGRNRRPNGLRKFDAALWKVETLADWLDRDDINGVFNRVLIRPAADAANREDQLHESVGKLIREQYDAVPREQKRRWQEKVIAPELTDRLTGRPSEFVRSDLIAMALNVGNASNLDKLTRGEGWTPEAVMGLLNANLTVEEWTFVQGIWDALETLWPDIAAAERKLTGVEPERVIPIPVETTAGTLRGGYYPVKYDRSRNPDAAHWDAVEAADLFSGVIHSAATPKGHTKARTEYAGSILLSVEGVLFGHLNNVIARISYGEYVQSALKFIRDGRVRQVVEKKVGPEYYAMLEPWLKGQVTDRARNDRDLEGIEQFAKRARLNFQMVAMGLRVSTGMAQFAGFTQSAAVVGKRRLAANIVKYAAAYRGTRNDLADFAFEKSEELRQRMQTRDRDIRDAMRDLIGKGGVLPTIQRAAFMHIGLADQFVSVPTWLAAYEEVIERGGEEGDAIAAGDKAVRRSQGSGREYALSAVQRPNSETMKLFTLFYSYFNVQYNRQRDIARYATTGDTAKAITMTFWVMMAAPVLGAVLAGDFPDDDDGEGLGGWLSWATRKLFFNLFAGVPVVRDAASFAERKVGGEYASYSATPLNRVGESTTKVVNLIGDLISGEEVSEKWLKQVIEPVGYFVGLPTGQVANTAQYVKEVFDGTQSPDNVGEFLYGLAKGPQEDQE